MSESRIQNAFSRTAILTVGRLLLFIVAGFAIGLVLGVASEAPELLAGHARGKTATVELDAALAARGEAEAARESARGLPDVAAPPTDYVPGEADDHRPVSDDRPVDDERAVLEDGGAPTVSIAGSGSTGGWAIQVGAFGDEPSARALETRLEGAGYPIEVLPAGPESNRWRVRVQPIGEESAARSTALRIEREERLPTWVIQLEGQPRG